MPEQLEPLPLHATPAQVHKRVLDVLINRSHIDHLTDGRGWQITELMVTAERLEEQLFSLMADVAIHHTESASEPEATN